MIDPIALAFDTIRDYLAAVPHDRFVSLSATILRDAASVELARHVVACGAFETSTNVVVHHLPDADAPVASMLLAGQELSTERARNKPKP